MSRSSSYQADYFDALYSENPDPWEFATSEYERDKYADTVAALPRERYLSGLEVGCSIGVLSRQLAARCDRLLSVDASEIALADARKRNADLTNLEFRRMRVPDDRPDGIYDLIVLSEVLYYFDDAEHARVTDLMLDVSRPGTDFILVHWALDTDYPMTGSEATEAFIRHVGSRMEIVRQERRERYRLDVLHRLA